jgi:hypothetical protein
MHTEGSALVGGFFMSGGLRRGDIPVFFDLTSGKGWKSMLTLFVFYFCQEQGRINEYRACSDLVINRNRLLATFTVCFAPWGNYITC